MTQSSTKTRVEEAKESGAPLINTKKTRDTRTERSLGIARRDRAVFRGRIVSEAVLEGISRKGGDPG